MVRSFFRKLSKDQMNSIGTAALIVAFFGIVSRILGLVRDRILAAHFGAGDELDIYYAAFRLPDLIFELLIVGSLAAAFVPWFSTLILGDDKTRAWRCANDLLIVLLTILGALSLVGCIFAPTIVHLMVPGFSEAKIDQTVELARVMFISPLFLAVSALFGSVLVSMKRFLLYASAPLLYNVGIIIGIVFIAPRTGPIGLAVGVVLGAFLHFVVHTIGAYRSGFQFEISARNPYKNKDVRKVLRAMGPRMFGSASNQIAFSLSTFFASLIPVAGMITVFQFAYNIQSVVLGLVGVSFALAAFPTLSAAYGSDKMEYFTQTFTKTLRRILYYAIPMSVLFWVLRAQIVRLVYGAGNFDKEATTITIDVLSILLVSLFAQCITPLLARVFYAMDDTRTPLYAALFAQVVNIGIIIMFFEMPYLLTYQIEAIAIAFTVASVVNAVLLLILVKRKLVDVDYWELTLSLLKIVLAAALAGAIAHIVKNFVGELFSPQIYVWQYLLQFFSSGIAGLLMYFGMSSLFGLKEFETIKKSIFLKLFGRPVVAAEEQHQGTGTH